MFTHLRSTAKSFFAKLILFVLIAMFGLWGIGDVFRTMGAGPASVATVGKTAITMQEYQRALQGGRKEPMDALNGLINDLLIEKEENAQGIVVSDDTVADFLSNIPDFKNKDGQFDKALYQDAIARTGNNEARYIENVRREIAGKLLLSPFGGGVLVPDELVFALYKTKEERRSADIIVLTPAFVEANAHAPTEAESKTYYDAHPKEFNAPEVRSVSYVALPIADVQSKVDVPEEEVKRAYEERKEEFRMPERRQVEELQFSNEQDARDAAAALAKGRTFEQVAASAPISNKGKTSLGLVGIQDIKGDAAGKIFSMKPGGVTEPELANFSWHIYHLSKIEPPRPETYEEARAAIAREIAARESGETGQKLMNNFEDTLAGGATFEQAAEKIGQKVQALGPVTRDGNTPQGSKASVPPYDNFLTVAFTTAEKDHSQAVQSADGSYFIVRVDSVSPEHVRPFAEVKDQSAKAAMAEKVKGSLEKTAEDISTKLRAGKKPDNAPAPVAVANLKHESVVVNEGKLQGKSLPPAMLGELFRSKLQQSTHAYPAEDGNYYMIATLTGITPAPQKLDPKIIEGIRTELKSTLTDEALLRYIAYLRTKYPVTIDSAAMGTTGTKENDSGE